MKEERKMKFVRNKSAAILIAILLTLSMAASMTLIPNASAHKPAWQIPTYAFISVQPNPLGLREAAYVNFWIDKVAATANSQYGDRWHNYTVTITNVATGATTKLGPFTSDDAGGSETTWVPPAIGNYTFVFNFPGQTIVGANPSPISGTQNPQSIGDYYQPSTSSTVTLEVTNQQVSTIPQNALPAGYWQNPIEATNLNWYSISGNWLGAGSYNATENFNPYSTAPTTGHIVWTKPYAPGGLIGGEFGNNEINSNYYATAQYETKFSPIIMNGVLYYTLIPGSSTSPEGWVAVNLRTGQTIWTQTPVTAGMPGATTSGTVVASGTAASGTTTLLRGQLCDYTSPNQFGALEYLWASEPTVAPNKGSTYGMYDGMTGNWICNIVNGTSASWVEGSYGEMLGYYINSTSNTMNLWNSTQAIMAYGNKTLQNTNWWLWRPPQGANVPWKYGIMWSVPMTMTMTSSTGATVNINTAYAASAGVASPLAISKIGNGIILVTDTPGPTIAFNQPGYIITEAYSTTNGKLLWGPLNQTQTPFTRLSVSAIGQGVYVIFTYESQTFVAYSVTSGQKLWTATTAVANVPWGYYVTSSMIAYGYLYTDDFGGYVNAFHISDGSLAWSYNTGDAGYNTPYGVSPIVSMTLIADNEIFLMGGHLYSPPLYNGADLYCVNATSGKLLWKEPSFAITNGACGCIADGYLVVPSGYDNQLYCFGKGLSATTVATSPVLNNNNQVLVTGTVTDQSPGQTCLGIPAAGTPAIGDAYMTPWMEYLYMQQPMPTNATGVPVTLTYIDPNNNTGTIGTTTSDMTGHYSYVFTPNVPGKYVITATFGGTGSYFGSTSETIMKLDMAPSATAAATATPTSVADTYFMPSVISIIVVMIIGFAVLASLGTKKTTIETQKPFFFFFNFCLQIFLC